ncbi:MAG: OsmC family protein [SAR202 cluster bacterium]|nr:hypothetical protein [Chloroflexota bacterium]MQG68874.1 OsmC family protein [SAR202 cluster bacterium]
MIVGTRLAAAAKRARDTFTQRPASRRVVAQATARLTGDGAATAVRMRGHNIIVDGPPTTGGDDTGPTPGDLIRAGLGACLAINYGKHAPTFDVELTEITVNVETDVDLGSSAGLDVDTPPGFGAVRFETLLTTNSPEARVRELVAFAEAHSPSLDDLTRGLHVGGQLAIRRPE